MVNVEVKQLQMYSQMLIKLFSYFKDNFQINKD